MKYSVVITRYRYYTVEAEDEDEAEEKAIEEYESDMLSPIADTSYDEVEVLGVEEDEE